MGLSLMFVCCEHTGQTDTLQINSRARKNHEGKCATRTRSEREATAWKVGEYVVCDVASSHFMNEVFFNSIGIPSEKHTIITVKHAGDQRFKTFRFSKEHCIFIEMTIKENSFRVKGNWQSSGVKPTCKNSQEGHVGVRVGLYIQSVRSC